MASYATKLQVIVLYFGYISPFMKKKQHACLRRKTLWVSREVWSPPDPPSLHAPSLVSGKDVVAVRWTVARIHSIPLHARGHVTRGLQVPKLEAVSPHVQHGMVRN